LLDERNQERTYVRKIITSVQKQWYKKSIVLSSVRPSVGKEEEEEEEEEAGAAAAAS
jgi:hypothetical protein